MKQWAAAAKVPLPQERVWVGFGDPFTPFGSREIFLPSCCTKGWTHLAIQGLLFHELGHVFDRITMNPALRAEFRQIAGVPRGWYWWKPLKTYREIQYSPLKYEIIKIAPGEMFAEEYAACALGLTQIGYQDAGYDSYGWTPPAGSDAAMCSLIDSAGT
jgi:hypothetical protein